MSKYDILSSFQTMRGIALLKKNRENNGFTPLTTLISREKFIMTKSRKKNMEFWKISTKPGNLFEVSAGECLKPGLLCSTAVGASPLTRRRR